MDFASIPLLRHRCHRVRSVCSSRRTHVEANVSGGSRSPVMRDSDPFSRRFHPSLIAMVSRRRRSSSSSPSIESAHVRQVAMCNLAARADLWLWVNASRRGDQTARCELANVFESFRNPNVNHRISFPRRWITIPASTDYPANIWIGIYGCILNQRFVKSTPSEETVRRTRIKPCPQPSKSDGENRSYSFSSRKLDRS
jgi:hypothetical protein